jgi:succinate dehydrogenase flavin-adding protein (antitoxin of CptAB toxin-antitoxin module)
MTHKRPHLGVMSETDLDQYAKFVDWQIIRCDDKDLTYWLDESTAILTERYGRQAIKLLGRLPYGLVRH